MLDNENNKVTKVHIPYGCNNCEGWNEHTGDCRFDEDVHIGYTFDDGDAVPDACPLLNGRSVVITMDEAPCRRCKGTKVVEIDCPCCSETGNDD